MGNDPNSGPTLVKSTDFLVRDGELPSSYVTEDKIGAGNIESALFDAQVCDCVRSARYFTLTHCNATDQTMQERHLGMSDGF